MAEKLTDTAIDALPSPPSGNRVFYDSEVTGFGVRVTSAGAKSFVLNYRARGRERRITIGSYPDWSVGGKRRPKLEIDAREKAKELKRQIDGGEDPMAQRHADRIAPTIEGLAGRYQAEHAEVWKRQRSAEEDAGLLRQLIVPRLGRLRVQDVQREDIEAFHRAVSLATPIRANRALSLLTKMFALAIRWRMRTDNPATGIGRNLEHKRERYLTPEELDRLLAELSRRRSQSSANAIRLLLLTGARRGELLSATWDQFDLTAGVWVKPHTATKQRKLHRIPLSAPARQLLAEMRAKSDGPALFPGGRGTAVQGSLKTFWAAVTKAADLPGLRLHDLRHSYASMLAGAGLSLPTIGALLGHSSPVTTQRYAHLADAALRQATERVGDIVAGAGKSSGEVVPLVRQRG